MFLLATVLLHMQSEAAFFSLFVDKLRGSKIKENCQFSTSSVSLQWSLLSILPALRVLHSFSKTRLPAFFFFYKLQTSCLSACTDRKSLEIRFCGSLKPDKLKPNSFAFIGRVRCSLVVAGQVFSVFSGHIGPFHLSIHILSEEAGSYLSRYCASGGVHSGQIATSTQGVM